MPVLIEHTLFFAYVGSAFAVAIVSLFWGTQSKILGASLLLASILLSNIIYAIFENNMFSFKMLNLIYGFFDLALVVVFLAIFSRSNRLERNRWAGVVAAIELCMAAADFAGSAGFAVADRFTYGLTLNLLTIAALIACLISFTPKSWDETLGVLRMKWIYLMSDLFSRVETALRHGRRAWMIRSKNAVAPKAIDAQIGAKIREARIICNLSRGDLAGALGISVAQIQKYESGSNRVSATTLFAISRVLDTDIGFFYEGVELWPRTSLNSKLVD